MSFATVAIVTGAINAVGGLVKGVDGTIKARRAKKEAEAAKAELDKQKNKFENLDTSNPYLNMENVMEDLTVNQQAAEFTKQQQMQSQANIMTQMRGAAGGSGIAALAQTMANQASLDSQASSASIAQQEQTNQASRAAEASRIQGLEREGELISRQAQQGKIETLMGMSTQELNAAREARAAAQQQVVEGVGDIATGAVQGIAGAKMKSGGDFLGGKVDANMLKALGVGGGSGGGDLSDADLQKIIAALQG